MDNVTSDVKQHLEATQLHTWPTTSSSVWNLIEKLSSSSKSFMLFWLSRSLWRLLLRPLLAWLCRSPRPKSDAAPLRRPPVQGNGAVTKHSSEVEHKDPSAFADTQFGAACVMLHGVLYCCLPWLTHARIGFQLYAWQIIVASSLLQIPDFA